MFCCYKIPRRSRRKMILAWDSTQRERGKGGRRESAATLVGIGHTLPVLRGEAGAWEGKPGHSRRRKPLKRNRDRRAGEHWQCRGLKPAAYTGTAENSAFGQMVKVRTTTMGKTYNTFHNKDGRWMFFLAG